MAILTRQNNVVWINIILLQDILVFLSDFKFSIRYLAENIKDLMVKHAFVILLDLLFILFVVLNNFSLVLGDNISHQIVVHFAQLNHFTFFFLFFFPMVNFKILKLFYKDFYTKENILKFVPLLILTTAIFLIFNKFSFTHDFILADNRHFSFYYFRKIYNNLIIRLLMIVWTSLITSLIILDNKELTRDKFIFAFIVCLGMVLVPAKLFEFRYLSLGYTILLIIIHYNSAKWKDFNNLIFNKYNLIFSIGINIITLFVFIKLPFNNSFFGGETSRFIW